MKDFKICMGCRNLWHTESGESICAAIDDYPHRPCHWFKPMPEDDEQAFLDDYDGFDECDPTGMLDDYLMHDDDAIEPDRDLSHGLHTPPLDDNCNW